MELNETNDNSAARTGGSSTNDGIDESIALPYFNLQFIKTVGLSVILGIVIIGIVAGNLFVIIAVTTERHLRKPQNNLIVSLAVSDLAVGVGVLPLALLYEVVDVEWTLGPVMCDIWVSTDIAACTASILNMVAIALDRYWSIKDIHYANSKRGQTVMRMIPIVWLSSILISVLPIIGWQDADYYNRIRHQRICLISQEVGFQVFSSIGSFYAPLATILTLHFFIYNAAKNRIRNRSALQRNEGLPLVVAELSNAMGYFATTNVFGNTPNEAKRAQPTTPEATLSAKRKLFIRLQSLPIMPKPCARGQWFRRPSLLRVPAEDGHIGNATKIPIILENGIEPGDKSTPSDSSPKTPPNDPNKKTKQRNPADVRRERRAFHTLAIITGAFVVCWLPFFALALVRPICNCEVDATLRTVFTWLGWLNSLLNPAIYTVFSPDFRRAFKRILLQVAWKRCVKSRRRTCPSAL